MSVTVSVGVIGGGPAATATVIGLLGAENLKITLVAASMENLDAQDINALHAADVKRIKRGKRKYRPFNIDKHFLLNVKSSEIIPSNLMVGGWSKLWGATIAEWDVNAEIYNGISSEDIKNEYKKIQSLLPSLKESSHQYRSNLVQELIQDFQKHETSQNKSLIGFQVVPSNLAIWNNTNERNTCIFCAKCLSGCETKSIYSAEQTLDNILSKENGKLAIYNGYAERIEEAQEKIRVHLSDKVCLEFDYIFVASGLISSVGLLQRSNLVSDIGFQETPMFLIPLIKLRGRSKSKSSEISLSEAFVDIHEDSRHQLIGSGQIYSLTKNLQEVALGKATSKLIKLIPAYITNRIIILMLFTKPSNEKHIIIRNSDGLSEVMFPKSYHRNNYKNVIKKVHSNFRILGFSAIFGMSILERPGLSYHYVGAFDQFTKESISEQNGLLKNTKNERIFLSDACSMTNIEPGPLTVTIMANSIRIAERFVKSIK
jgi:hypothetical protein